MSTPKPRRIDPRETGALITPSRTLKPGFYAVSRRDGNASFRVGPLSVLALDVYAVATAPNDKPEAVRIPTARRSGNVAVRGNTYDADYLRAAKDAHGPLTWHLTKPITLIAGLLKSRKPLLCGMKRGKVVAVIAARL